MFKRIINRAQVRIRIKPIDPLLIKSGQPTVGGVDMSFLRTYRFGEKEQPLIPGSSLKGVIRSYAEKICRTLRVNPVPVCLPYCKPDEAHGDQSHQASCGLLFEKIKKETQVKHLPSPDLYRLSCPACRLFGSHVFKGHCAISDGHLDGQAVFEMRNGVAIDRFTGGVAGSALYDLEVLVKGEFVSTIEIQNFERWQLGLLSLVLRDLEEGLIHIGSGKSRGLGRIGATIEEMKLSYYPQDVTTFQGIGALATAEEAQKYGFFKETGGAPKLGQPTRVGIRQDFDILGNWKTLLEPAVHDLNAFIQDVVWPGPLETYHPGGH